MYTTSMLVGSIEAEPNYVDSLQSTVTKAIRVLSRTT